MSTQASPDMIWRVVKSNNAFIRKQRAGRGAERTVLSSEPRNLAARSTFKLSGVAHKGASIQLSSEGKFEIVNTAGEKTALSHKKPGQAAKKASEGRKDLRTASKALSRRLVRLTTRKSRKSWKQE